MTKGLDIFAAKITCMFFILTFMACGKEEAGFGPVPTITFEKIEVEQGESGTDSVVHITFGFTDGDGDIGLGDTDTIPPFDRQSAYWQNVPVKIYHKVNGSFEELLNPLTNEPFDLPSERVPRITPEGKNKAISGNITIHISANPLNTQPAEVKYEIKLLDRALNVSNTVVTPSVLLKH
ncbi:MAG: hypothetical protein JXR19_08100 [Bacteroidia bacterium]